MKPCRQPRCPELVESGYCTDHGTERNRIHRRSRAGQSVYGTVKWKRLRAKKLAASPLCERQCGAIAEHVHHRKDIFDFPELTWEIANLESLCKPCHGRETIAELRQRTY